MADIVTRQGQTYDLGVTVDDASATDVTLDVWSEDEIIITSSATFVNKEATIEVGIIDDPVGTYDALVTVNYSDGKVDILPLQDSCLGDNACEFLTFEICEGKPGDS